MRMSRCHRPAGEEVSGEGGGESVLVGLGGSKRRHLRKLCREPPS